MSNYEMTGTIKRIGELKVISENFSVQEFILHVPDPKYPQDVKFQVSNKGLDLLKPELVGSTAKVTFDIRGRATKSGYWNTLACWKIEAQQRPQNGQQFQQPDQPAPHVPQNYKEAFPDAEVEDDSIPF